MRTIKYTISTGFIGADHEGEFNVPDDVSDEEIDELVCEEVWEHINYFWEDVSEEEEEEQ